MKSILAALALFAALLPAAHAQEAAAPRITVSIQGTLTATVGPVPIAVTFLPVSPLSIADNAAAGLVASVVSVAMSDGSAFRGTLALTGGGSAFALNGNNVVTARALTKADDAVFNLVVSATQP